MNIGILNTDAIEKERNPNTEWSRSINVGSLPLQPGLCISNSIQVATVHTSPDRNTTSNTNASNGKGQPDIQVYPSANRVSISPTRVGNGQPGTQGPDMETKAVQVEDVGLHDGESSSSTRLGEDLICAIEEGSQAKETIATWSSILGRQPVSKKNLPYYAPSIVEGKPIVHVNSSQFAYLQEHYENLIIGGTNNEATKGNNDIWETHRKRHTSKATPVAEFIEKGVAVVQGKVQEVMLTSNTNHGEQGKNKGKGIELQDGNRKDDGNQIRKEGFMKDARNSSDRSPRAQHTGKGDMGTHTIGNNGGYNGEHTKVGSGG
ncbi:hypothetical protein FRX31_029524 [Thalictrum thalictroides]|uniref:Uncharacterized protein n=1 Tax=Thalictrum thalictroides TaxID=46969 RepID=A0A7J6V875_THATH|nr:hypothetical protein FRX31_029524 [Thalictrum thalictroides]